MSHISEVERVHHGHVNAHDPLKVTITFHTFHVNHYTDQLLLGPAPRTTCEKSQALLRITNNSCQLLSTPTSFCQRLTTPTNPYARLTMEDNNAPSTPGNEASGFTTNEAKLICAVMQNLTSEIQVGLPHPQLLQSRITNLWCP